jgi:acyl carrier protein
MTTNGNHHDDLPASGNDVPPPPDAAAIGRWLASQIADLLGTEVERLDPHAPFDSFGLSSREAVTLSGDLEEWLRRRLSPTLLYEYPSIEALARHLAPETESRAPGIESREPGTDRARTIGEPLAVIGIGCRFPGADGPQAFWRLLCDGVDAIREVPADRWDAASLYDPNPGAAGKMNTRWGGFLERIDAFDAHFFGVAPREAERMDPQQRILLEVAWEALEDAGITADRLAGTQTGVFVGISSSDYALRQYGDPMAVDAYAGLATPQASPPIGCHTCWICAGRAWRSILPARRHWSLSTWPVAVCVAVSATWRWLAGST